VADELAEELSNLGLMERIEAAAVDEDSGNLLGESNQALDERGVDPQDSAAVLPDLFIEEITSLRIRWQEGVGPESTKPSKTVDGTGTTATMDRDADVRLQMFAHLYPVTTPEEFHQSLIHHLRCQIRDCYISMGIAPPQDVRIQGPGFYNYVGWYTQDDFYQDYHDTTTTITDWQEQHTPDELLI
jgi:hypothetical protein